MGFSTRLCQSSFPTAVMYQYRVCGLGSVPAACTANPSIPPDISHCQMFISSILPLLTVATHQETLFTFKHLKLFYILFFLWSMHMHQLLYQIPAVVNSVFRGNDFTHANLPKEVVFLLACNPATKKRWGHLLIISSYLEVKPLILFSLREEVQLTGGSSHSFSFPTPLLMVNE